MQAITGDQNLAQSTLYPLAEKMVAKMIESNLIQAEAGLCCDVSNVRTCFRKVEVA